MALTYTHHILSLFKTIQTNPQDEELLKITDMDEITALFYCLGFTELNARKSYTNDINIQKIGYIDDVAAMSNKDTTKLVRRIVRSWFVKGISTTLEFYKNNVQFELIYHQEDGEPKLRIEAFFKG